MIKVTDKTILYGSILFVTIDKNTLYIIDNTYTFYTLDFDELKLLNNQTITSNFKPIHKFSHATAISKNLLLNLPINSDSRSFLLSLSPKLSQIATIKSHKKAQESSCFTSSGDLLITGGMDGKIFLHDTEHNQLLSALPNQPDYISALKLNDDDSILVSCCYDKFATIYDMDKYKKIHKFKLPDVGEDLIFFDENRYIYFICRNGAGVLYETKHHKIITTQNHFSQWPTKIVKAPNTNYGLIGTRANNLYVIDLLENKQILNVKLDNIGINSINFHENRLIIGFSNGVIEKIDYNNGLENLKIALDNKDYDRAKIYLNENIFLSLDPLSNRFDEAWPEVLKGCTLLLQDEKLEEAINKAAPFLDKESRANEFDFYTKQQDKVFNLQKLIDEEEYIKAYAYTDQYPYLKKIYLYQQLEEHWNSVFNRVRKLMEDDPLHNKERAEEIIKPYFKVNSKRDLVVNIISNFDKFVSADKFVKNREFGRYFKLCKEYKFLENSDMYHRVEEFAARLYSKLITLEQTREYKEASEVIKILVQFEEYKERIEDVILDIQYKSKFINAVKSGDTKSAYDILSFYDKARFLDEYIVIAKEFNTTLDSAKKLAYSGNPGETITTLSKYLKIAYTTPKSIQLIKVAYLHEIKNTTRNDVNWDISIKQLINLFGKSEDIAYHLQSHDKAWGAYTRLESRGDPLGYTKLDLPLSIL